MYNQENVIHVKFPYQSQNFWMGELYSYGYKYLPIGNNKVMYTLLSHI